MWAGVCPGPKIKKTWGWGWGRTMGFEGGEGGYSKCGGGSGHVPLGFFWMAGMADQTKPVFFRSERGRVFRDPSSAAGQKKGNPKGNKKQQHWGGGGGKTGGPGGHKWAAWGGRGGRGVNRIFFFQNGTPGKTGGPPGQNEKKKKLNRGGGAGHRDSDFPDPGWTAGCFFSGGNNSMNHDQSKRGGKQPTGDRGKKKKGKNGKTYPGGGGGKGQKKRGEKSRFSSLPSGCPSRGGKKWTSKTPRGARAPKWFRGKAFQTKQPGGTHQKTRAKHVAVWGGPGGPKNSFGAFRLIFFIFFFPVGCI